MPSQLLELLYRRRLRVRKAHFQCPIGVLCESAYTYRNKMAIYSERLYLYLHRFHCASLAAPVAAR